MKKPRHISTAGGRIGRVRKGSVMIMVVALLLLLALMGTAWLSTTRNDRGASVANVANVQIDLLTQGVSNLAATRIVDGVLGHRISGAAQSAYRPWTFLDPLDNTNPAQSTFVNYDWVVTPSARTALLPAVMCYDRNWLASRAPVGDNNDNPYWPAVTAALGSRQIGSPIGNTDSVKVFESPYVNSTTALGPGLYTGEYVNRTFMQPTSLLITAADGTVRTHPAFLIGGGYYLAADTDGDGIADAGLWRMPLGEQNGVTYYAAVRIIDNNSAVNVSVAWKPMDSGDTPTNLSNFIPDLFPTNVDLWRMLRGNNDTNRFNQLNRLNAYRFGNALTDITPTIELGAYDDVNNGLRADVTGFLSAYDALWHQLGLRIDNPGRNQAGQMFRAVDIGDQMGLARGFVIAPFSAASPLETRLADTLINNNPALPYLPSDTVGWYRNNFKYFNMTGAANDIYSRRALLVARNGVSQAIPDTGALATWQLISPGTYYPGNPSTQTADSNPGQNDVTAGLPTKVSLNTGNFRELCRAYWHVMADRIDIPNDPTPFYDGTDPFGQVAYAGMAFDEPSGTATAEANQWRMFRSSLRPGGGTGPMLLPPQQLLLRSALAAANTMELRWGPMNAPGSNVFQRYLNSNAPSASDDTSIEGKAHVNDIPLTLKDGTQATARVFGNKPQPFIAEVYANNDGAMHQKKQPDPDPDPNVPPPAPVPPFHKNPNGFVSVTLHNPYTQNELNGPINIGGWQLIAVDRGSGGPTNAQVIYTFPTTEADYRWITIDAASAATPGLLTLWNYDTENPGDANDKDKGRMYYPADITQSNVFPPPDPTGVAQAPSDPKKTHLVPNLSRAFGKELILVRPQVPGNTVGGSPAAAAYWAQAVPVDSFDFTGLPAVSSTATGTFTAIVYRRNCEIKQSNGKSYSEFRCVYPGRYDGRKAKLRQQGTFEHTFTLDPDTGDTVGSLFTGVQQPLFDDAGGTYPATYNSNDSAKLFRIPIAAEDSPGPFGKGKTSGNNFFHPFGGFARNLDVMQAPFIGAYVIVDNAGNVQEINPVTMDAAFAEDTDTANDAREQVGRFAPIMGSTVGTADDWSSNKTEWRYRWAMKTLDFLCVDLPAKDFLPGVTNEYVQGLQGNSAPMPVYNTSASDRARPSDPMVANRAENGVGIEGLININTAPLPVLATIPFTKNRDTNLVIARAIVHYRDVDDGSGTRHGPFTSLFDLYRVAEFRRLSDLDMAAAHPANGSDGMLLPGPGSNGVYGIQNDFNERYLLLNRISNMVTLRSDTFTVYVLVQGWRNAGTNHPVLAAQRRVAFIVDRSGVTQAIRKPVITNIPLE